MLKKHNELVGSFAFHYIPYYWGETKSCNWYDSSCELQSQKCFVAHDIFPRVNVLLTSIRETFKTLIQGLAPEHIILYCFNVRGEEQKVHFLVTIKPLKL